MVWWCGPAILEEKDFKLKSKPKKVAFFMMSTWGVGVGAIVYRHFVNP